MSGEPVDGAGLHRLGRVLADGVLRLRHVHLDELGGTRRQGLHGDLDAGSDRTAHVVAVGVDDIEVGRGAEVDDHDRRAIPLAAGNGVDDAIGAHLGGVLHGDTHAGARAGPDHEGHESEVALAHLRPLHGKARDDRGDGHLVDHFARTLVAQRQETDQEPGDLIAGAVPHGGQAPMLDDLAAVHEADDGLRVANVHSEKHGPTPGRETCRSRALGS